MKMDNENDETMTPEDNMIVGLQGMIQDQIEATISETQIECIQENATAIDEINAEMYKVNDRTSVRFHERVSQ